MRAILFDVFGTLVDWRSSLIEQFQALERELGGTLPCVELTDRWRQQYKPAMDRVRNGQAPWQHLDQLHRQSLEALAGEFGLALDEALLQRITGFWHRLRPWPDTLAGMHALKADYWLAALSNGNTALMLDVARHAGLPWDMLLCADLFGHYKPDPQVYLGACRLLDLPPQEVMLCAAHNYDLKAARALGLKTAFIARPLEYGPGQTQDLAAEQDWDLIASDLLGLQRLGLGLPDQRIGLFLLQHALLYQQADQVDRGVLRGRRRLGLRLAGQRGEHDAHPQRQSVHFRVHLCTAPKVLQGSRLPEIVLGWRLLIPAACPAGRCAPAGSAKPAGVLPGGRRRAARPAPSGRSRGRRWSGSVRPG